MNRIRAKNGPKNSLSLGKCWKNKKQNGEKKTEKPRPTSWKKVPQKVEEREEKDLKWEWNLDNNSFWNVT